MAASLDRRLGAVEHETVTGWDGRHGDVIGTPALAFLPEGLVVNDKEGTRSVGWSQLQSVQPDGQKATVVTAAGSMTIKCDFYGLTPEELGQRCQRLQQLAAGGQL